MKRTTSSSSGGEVPVMKAPTLPSTVSGGPTSRMVALFLLMSRRSGDTISVSLPSAAFSNNASVQGSSALAQSAC